LVPRFGQAHEGIPGLAFNHAISRIMLDNQPMWVDTTDDVCRFGMLPPGDPGRKVLVIDGQTSSLTELPEANLQDHLLKLHGEVNCAQPAQSLPTHMSATAFGCPDYELRSAAREAKVAFGPLLAARFQSIAGTFALEKQSFTSVSALNENFSWEAEGSTIGIVSMEENKCFVQAPFWIPSEWKLALHRRKLTLYLNLGYPLTLDEEFEFALPAKAKLTRVPGVNENNTQPLQWRLEWVRVADDKLMARFHVELSRGDLSDEQTALFQQQLPQLLSGLVTSAGWSVGP